MAGETIVQIAAQVKTPGRPRPRKPALQPIFCGDFVPPGPVPPVALASEGGVDHVDGAGGESSRNPRGSEG